MKRRAATTAATAQHQANGEIIITSQGVGAEPDKDKGRSRKALHPLVPVGAAAAIACVILTAAATYGGSFPDTVGSNLRSLSASSVGNSNAYENKDDIFIAIKTTHSNQKRVSSILTTYWNFAPQYTAFFSDTPPPIEEVEDADVKSLPSWPTMKMSDPLLQVPTADKFNLIDTSCSTEHTKEGLCCKTAAEIVYYHDHSNADWLCHVDDDTFVNYPALQEYLKEHDASEEHFIGYSGVQFPVEKDRKNKLEDAKKKKGDDAPRIKRAPRINLQVGDQSSGNDEGTIMVTYATGGAGWCLSRPLVMRGIDKLANLAQTCLDIVYSDDVTLGYVVQVELGIEMKNERRLHSHLDHQVFASKDEVMKQLTFGSGVRTVVDPIVAPKGTTAKDVKSRKELVSLAMTSAKSRKVFSFVSYPGASFVDEKTKLPPENDPLGFHALYCDFWPEKCGAARRK